MIRSLAIAPLSPPEIDQAFPLYRELVPAASLAGWQRLSGRYLAPDAVNARRSFIAARRADYFRGLFSFEICPSVGGSVLLIDHVVVLDPLSPRDLAAGLVDYVRTLAQRYGCRSCLVTLSEASAWLSAEWSDPDGSRRGLPLACIIAPPLADGSATAETSQFEKI